MGRTETQVNCKSIFKSGGTAISKDLFTKQWIELINQSEKRKETLMVRQQVI